MVCFHCDEEDRQNQSFLSCLRNRTADYSNPYISQILSVFLGFSDYSGLYLLEAGQEIGGESETCSR